MRLQMRFLNIILIALVAAGGLLALQRSFDLVRVHHVLQSELKQSKQYFNTTLSAEQQPLKTLSEDYSFWDEMVDFVHTHNLTFAHENIDTGLDTFDANAAWVFDAQNHLVYSSQADSDKPVAAPALPTSFFNRLQQAKFSHFYLKDGADIVEIRAATIVPGNDPDHQQPASGYWLVARVVDAAYLNQLASLSKATVRLDAATASQAEQTSGDHISFALPLNDWTGKPVAVLRNNSSVSVIDDLNHLYHQQVLLLSVVGLLLLVIVAIVIWKWVLQPIARINQSITTQKAELLTPLSTSKSEFGGLARTVQEFFAQKIAIEESAIQRADLEHLNQEKSRFLKIAAHELKGPVTIIKLLSEALPQNPAAAGNDTLTESLDTITHQARKMALIITDLRLASQEKGGKEMEYHPMLFSFDDFLRREITANQYITEQKLDFGGGTGQQCLADPERLSQVITNVIRNASKYAPGTGSIEITSHVENDQIVVSVTDHGIGISSEDQQHVFDAYYRAPSVQKDFEGLGLGLSICKEIIEHTGGHITVHSALGSGSTFSIYLPAAKPTNGTQAQA